MGKAKKKKNVKMERDMAASTDFTLTIQETNINAFTHFLALSTQWIGRQIACKKRLYPLTYVPKKRP